MKRLALAIGAATGAIVLASAAIAHEMDTDQDGLYSLAEMRTEYADLTKEQYGELDTNEDEAVDAEELADAIAKGVLAPME